MINWAKLCILSSLFISCSTHEIESRDPSNFQSCLELMTSIMKYERFSGSHQVGFSKAKNLRDLEMLYGDESFFSIQARTSNKEIIENNFNIFSMLNQKITPREGVDKARQFITKVDKKMLDDIYKKMADSEVNKNHWCYDTKGTIGFCFGRATIAHLEAINMGVHPDLVKKIWIVGDMGIWGHHVATVVYSVDGPRVLDTNQGRPYKLSDWFQIYTKQKKSDKDIMIFMTQAGRFGPEDARPYNPFDLFNTSSDDFDRAGDFFKGYFFDYFESLDNRLNPPFYKKK